MRRWWLGLAVVALVLMGCNPASGADSQTRLKVVATHSILGDLVRNVAGDKIDLVVLVGPGSDTHSYEPAPSDSRTVAEAKLLFENGLGFETWLDDLYAASSSRATRVVVSEGLALLAREEHAAGGESDQAEHGEFDPHVWQSVPNAIQMVKTIQAALRQADPANAADYQANAEAYIGQLQTLHTYIAEQANTIPPERRKIVTNHDALGYFAHEYGFVVVGDALGALSTEGGEPSARQLAELADAIRAAGVPTIFAENVQNADVMELVAREAGVTLGPPLYTDALGLAGSEGETYLKLMRYNMDAIAGALK